MTTADPVAPTEPVELTTGPADEVLMPNERAKRLYPVLSEYAGKLGALTERLLDLRATFPSGQLRDHQLIECARLICLHDTLNRRLSPILSTASALLDHAKLDEFIADELALRWDEAEEQYRQADLVVKTVAEFLMAEKGNINAVRKLIEKSGRYKSPV